MIGWLPQIYRATRRKASGEAWTSFVSQSSIVKALGGLLLAIPEPPSELAVAVAEFNSGQFWQCPETLEGIWIPEGYPLRLFYHGLIKAAVGMLHLQGRNRRGARLKLGEALYTLAPFVPEFMGIDVARLQTKANERLNLVQDGQHLDWKSVEALPPVRIGWS